LGIIGGYFFGNSYRSGSSFGLVAGTVRVVGRVFDLAMRTVTGVGRV